MLNYRENDEHDACALIAYVRKDGTPSHGTVKRAINALEKMGHRSGGVDGEGDGCGVQTDIPRLLWARDLQDEAGQNAALAEDPRFFVGHFFIPMKFAAQAEQIKDSVRGMLKAQGITLLVEDHGDVRHDALGKIARSNEPEFWQVAGLTPEFAPGGGLAGDRALFAAQLAIEKDTPVHVVSLSRHIAIYKVHGNADILDHYYPQLSTPDFQSVICLGHSRYSTNTLSNFERVQPFALLGHNGEINTVDKLRREAQMLGIPITHDGSDSQDMDRAMHGLIVNHGLSLIEASEVIFPPMAEEVDALPDDLRALYRYYRWVLGPLAQGPAAIVSRYGDECVFGVDALGLRPLWFGESATEYFFSSEQGVVPISVILGHPKPLAPGEKVAIQVRRTPGNTGSDVIPYHELQRAALSRSRAHWDLNQVHDSLKLGKDITAYDASLSLNAPEPLPLEANRVAAFNWASQDVDYVEALCKTGNEPIGSLGYDGPLASLSPEKQSLADYFKEAVAVVTNPAMDREREMEHFSTRMTLGPRPGLTENDALPERAIELKVPILADVAATGAHLDAKLIAETVAKVGSTTLEGVFAYFGADKVAVLPIVYSTSETAQATVEKIAARAVELVQGGVEILVLDDTTAFTENTLPLDPHLALITVDKALRLKAVSDEPGAAALRRTSSLVLRSGGLRNLHDIIFAVGNGADAVVPYLMMRQAIAGGPADTTEEDKATRLYKLLSTLQKGLEKVISTMGTHELRGYGRMFASIGLHSEVAQTLEIRNFCGSSKAGFSFLRMDEQARKRLETARSETPVKKREDLRFYPKVWKLAGQVGAGTAPYSAYTEKVQNQEKDTPVSLRHLLDLRLDKRTPIDRNLSNTRVKEHDLPLMISSMSFGSQSEIAFRAYAEAARQLNIVCMNGEGGEIKDMYGKFRKNRGQQIASGRFGVNIEMLNASDFLEIKIGQGAKPGEGGHLPGKKVSVKVALARHATPGVDLISPSNNHDIYSIEDLAQIIEELHTANPRAKVSVKVPVVPGIGTIALGVAKAGADIITLSGYDGGTGAARIHALKHVGMPVEIGVKEAHRALVQAGVRDEVELWCDGGMKNGVDVVKMILLGANRCGFGTLSMVATGCTVCHGCQLDTCHVGIATQIETLEQAQAHGLKRFVPREPVTAVEALCKLFGSIGDEIRDLTAQLGFVNTQEMVGKSDLLEQVRGQELVDLFELTAPVLPMITYGLAATAGNEDAFSDKVAKRIRRPLSYMSKLISSMVAEQTQDGADVVLFEDDRVNPTDRELGTHLAGAIARGEVNHTPLKTADLTFQDVIPGNGLGAFNSPFVNVRVQGGAQDGVAKGAYGGKVVILRGLNDRGERVDGSVGKGFGYGAQGGTFLIQGDADSRCGIRLSGADIVIGGEIREPLNDALGCLGARANIKGFAFEYMTSGRAVVLGDPGPWMCAGMTGGVVYIKLNPEMGLDRAAIMRRIGRGANVAVADLNDKDKQSIAELLTVYAHELRNADQHTEADRTDGLVARMLRDEAPFVKVQPVNLQVDQTVSTE
ncbi:MAG: glutamate synthase-related protein [Capsulimonas sp.]|uniref:glutamate synthase-related protein n=1 Tax=Capsulimonas sp. TaxID=2494211 RepID=UPI003265B9F2